MTSTTKAASEKSARLVTGVIRVKRALRCASSMRPLLTNPVNAVAMLACAAAAAPSLTSSNLTT